MRAFYILLNCYEVYINPNNDIIESVLLYLLDNL